MPDHFFLVLKNWIVWHGLELVVVVGVSAVFAWLRRSNVAWVGLLFITLAMFSLTVDMAADRTFDQLYPKKVSYITVAKPEGGRDLLINGSAILLGMALVFGGSIHPRRQQRRGTDEFQAGVSGDLVSGRTPRDRCGRI